MHCIHCWQSVVDLPHDVPECGSIKFEAGRHDDVWGHGKRQSSKQAACYMSRASNVWACDAGWRECAGRARVVALAAGRTEVKSSHRIG